MDLFPIFPILLVELQLEVHVSFLAHVFVSIDNVMVVAHKQLIMLSREFLMKLAMTKYLGNLFRREFAAEESGKNDLSSIFSNSPNKLSWISPDSLVDWIHLANKDISFIGTEGFGHSLDVFCAPKHCCIGYGDVEWRGYQIYLIKVRLLFQIYLFGKVKNDMLDGLTFLKLKNWNDFSVLLIELWLVRSYDKVND